MNKKILAAAALALVSGAALADGPQLYGILDFSVVTASSVATTSTTTNGVITPNTSAGSATGTFTGAADGTWLPSLFGIQGGEDIGNGMKVSYKLESNMSATNGTAGDGGKLFDRWATLGLSGNFGAINAGEMLDPLFLESIVGQARGVTHAASLALLGQLKYDTTLSGVNTVAGVMSSNWVTYALPAFNNINVKAGYQFGNVAGSNSNSSGQYVEAHYAANGLQINAGYESRNNATNTQRLNKGLLGAVYTVGDLAVNAQTNTFKTTGATAAVSGSTVAKEDAQGYELGANYKLNPKLDLSANYVWFNDNAANARPTSVSAAANYGLSKRTHVYVMVQRVSNNGQAGFAPLYTAVSGVAGSDSTAVALGMNHTF
jgi:predicted porin